jgi:hypothetical protein
LAVNANNQVIVIPWQFFQAAKYMYVFLGAFYLLPR